MLVGPRKHYTPDEVRRRLVDVSVDGDARSEVVRAAAAMTGIWLSRLSERAALDLGRSADRLPTVVYWYRQGLSAHEIGRRLSPFGTAWDADRALDAATALIAQTLNRGDAATLVA
jgi:hypothetical protein